MNTPTLAAFDRTDLDNFAHAFPRELFEVHRRVAPVWWHEPTARTPGGEGFWSVATYAETLEVLKDPVTYSSERGGGRAYRGTLLGDSPGAGVVLNMMDDPRHARIRRLVSAPVIEPVSVDPSPSNSSFTTAILYAEAFYVEPAFHALGAERS